MGENNERRTVLGDVTNQSGNKGIQFDTRSLGSKPLSGSKRAAENTIDDSHLSKQVCVGLEKDRCFSEKCLKVVPPNKVGLSPLRGGKTYRLKTGSGDIKELSCSALDSIDLGEDRHLVSAVDLNDANKEGMVSGSCCEKNCREGGNECQGEETRGISDVGESDFTPEDGATQVLSDNGKSVGGDCVGCSWSDSVETSRVAESQETRSFGLERCTLFKGDGSNSSAAGVDLLKNCPCSFCTKVGYIWSDLQCQDVKGRMSTLAKSRKEVSNLVQKYTKETAASEAQGNSSTAPPLETDLKTMWKSLFQHMDNIYAAESSQLQSSFAVLKEVREDYKMNLEMINVTPADTQQCSSDDMKK
ncbi:hypothetical protein RND81_13G203700 [Saponaria officinalis]|uniref:Uncharacterized protein n=1 Tax=Saponaria officinalis TaxID=3572 RepID=A0AAW1H2U7_SAPOF